MLVDQITILFLERKIGAGSLRDLQLADLKISQ